MGQMGVGHYYCAMATGNNNPPNSIDLNADLGEYRTQAALDRELRILRWISSCNIACGGHCGDAESMRRIALAAQQSHVAIGAHPSYPDQEHFGRRTLAISGPKLAQSIDQQIRRLATVCEQIGAPLSHCKAHGALYNDAAATPALAKLVVGCIADFSTELIVLGPPKSALQQAAEAADLRFVAEGFVDRAYQADGSLVPRSKPGAIMPTLEQRVGQARALVNGQLTVAHGDPLPLRVGSLCLHGDDDLGPATAEAINQAFEADGLTVAGFASV